MNARGRRKEGIKDKIVERGKGRNQNKCAEYINKKKASNNTKKKKKKRGDETRKGDER